jgi:AraC-like DNA-binding protein
MLRFDQAGRGYHACREWHPRPDEAPYVELLFHQAYPQSPVAAGAPPPQVAAGAAPHVATGESWRVVPDASAHLLFTAWGSAAGGAGGPREPTLRLVGARSQYVDTDPAGRTLMIGLRLRPGVLSSLIGTEARHLTDRTASAEDVFGKAARDLLDRIVAAPIPESAAHDLAAFVVGKISARPRRPTDPTVLAAALSRTASVEAAADAMGLTPRAVHRGAITGIGLAPKRLVRIQRLHRALALLLPPRSRPLATAAAEAGYADQAHLSRECSELLGESPARFLARGVRNVQERAAVSA